VPLIRGSVGLLAAVTALFFTPVFAAAQTVSFGDEALGTFPKNFEHGLAGEGDPGRWEVVQDDTATGGKALAQLTTDRAEHRFLVAIYKPIEAANVEITTRFKAVAGKTDQAGGVVVRAINARNYYIARANALEDNVRFYRVKGGRRQQLATLDNVKVTPGEWHTLTLRAEADRFTVLYDGKPMHATVDTTGFPRPASGRVGLWTKADSITRFDWMEIKVLP
jgi:hypothetical protein